MLCALDLGSITGWATWDGSAVASGTREFPALGAPALRYKAFREWVAPMIEGCMLCGYEMPHLRNLRTSQFLIGLVNGVHEACATHRAQWMSIHSLTLKKFVTEHGHADKATMYRSALAHGWLDGQRRSDGTPLAELEPRQIVALDDRFDAANNQVDAIAVLYYLARYGQKRVRSLDVVLPGADGFAAPPKVKAMKNDDERLFERIAHTFDGGYEVVGDDDE